jgi:lipopolysaccharide transport system permease protein
MSSSELNTARGAEAAGGPLPAPVSGATEPQREKPHLVIRPSHGWVPVRLGDLWRYRELVGFLAWRDISVRYKQTALGVAWAVVQPFLAMLVFVLFFGHIAGFKTADVPYPLYVYSGMLLWQFFSFALTQSSQSLVANQNLVTKVYFPRLAIPVAVVSAGLVDFCIASTVLGGMMGFYGVGPGLRILVFPAFMVLGLLTALGVGLWLSALAVQYRDVQYLIPFTLQLWFFVTPVVYQSVAVPHFARLLLKLNPMTGVIEGFRWALIGTPVNWAAVAISACVAAAVLVTGLFYFRRMEVSFADRI